MFLPQGPSLICMLCTSKQGYSVLLCHAIQSNEKHSEQKVLTSIIFPQGSLDRYHGQHPLRERARKLGQGILIIRFVFLVIQKSCSVI